VSDIDKLYLDDLDYYGLFYWYKDAKEYVKQINSAVNA